ncbi:ROK family protein [Paenibacillus terrigena]|uniref:ROK family protein n=1 Tax=Paenibacillus terrigena TaxID=369333 RepID=UPI0003733D02|nr:ROK family protein [Paenibacillus terrigena]
MNRYTIVFDVGGTEIRSAIVSESGKVLEKTARVYPAYSNQSRHFLLDYLYELIKKQAATISGSDLIAGIGYVFPGPCDLDRGISYIREQKKFESLYGVSIIDAMRDRIVADTRLLPRVAADYRIFFDQDTTWASLQPRELMHVGG